METLPSELSQRIFSLLTYRHLASTAKVCRTWKSLSSQPELWRSLYVQRWGLDKAATVIISPLVSSWKAAYEVQDRCDRIGMGWTIVREGDSIYTAQKGLLLRVLDCPGDNSSAPKCGSNPRSFLLPDALSEGPQGMGTIQVGKRTSNAGLVHKLFKFVAELDYSQNPVSKRQRVL